MKNQVLANPFVVGRYVSDDFFCDRKQETDFLRKQIRNGRNVALISSRRMGKSGLVAHFFNQSDVSEEYYTFYVDIYATSSFSEFVYLLGKAIYEQLKPRKTVWAERFFQVISSLRVGFSFMAFRLFRNAGGDRGGDHFRADRGRDRGGDAGSRLPGRCLDAGNIRSS